MIQAFTLTADWPFLVQRCPLPVGTEPAVPIRVGTKFYLAMPQILRAITGQHAPDQRIRTSASKQFKGMMGDKLITWQGENAPTHGVSILVERGAAKSVSVCWQAQLPARAH
jgi:hypothetical protein